MHRHGCSASTAAATRCSSTRTARTSARSPPRGRASCARCRSSPATASTSSATRPATRARSRASSRIERAHDAAAPQRRRHRRGRAHHRRQRRPDAHRRRRGRTPSRARASSTATSSPRCDAGIRPCSSSPRPTSPIPTEFLAQLRRARPPGLHQRAASEMPLERIGAALVGHSHGLRRPLRRRQVDARERARARAPPRDRPRQRGHRARPAHVVVDGVAALSAATAAPAG